jgi:hypothetical protein
MSEFKTVRSEGTEARIFEFEGKFVAKTTYTNEYIGTKKKRLYIQPDGLYRIVYDDGNVSKKMSAEAVRKEDAQLAKNAGLQKVVKLD